MDNVLISFIIPVYNVSPYLEECIQSIRCQDFGGDIEIICINDASTDNSLEILRQAKDKYSITVIDSAINCGVSHSRNIGLDSAKGKYIWFVDGDDSHVVDSYIFCYKFLPTLLFSLRIPLIIFGTLVAISFVAVIPLEWLDNVVKSDLCNQKE